MVKNEVVVVRFLKIILCILLLTLSACEKPQKPSEIVESTTPAFDFLERLTLEELDRAIERGENLYVYFAWTKNSSECVRLQENFLEPNIDYYNWNGLIRVVDLDEELPDALEDKTVRSILNEKYGIRYAPSFMFVKFGNIESAFEWTPETNDLVNGVNLEFLRDWMTSVGLMK